MRAIGWTCRSGFYRQYSVPIGLICSNALFVATQAHSSTPTRTVFSQEADERYIVCCRRAMIHVVSFDPSKQSRARRDVRYPQHPVDATLIS